MGQGACKALSWQPNQGGNKSEQRNTSLLLGTWQGHRGKTG